MAMRFLALLWGYLVLGGQRIGFASLVDLETGNVVWFNLLVGGFGDLREPGGARSAMGDLLAGFPL